MNNTKREYDLAIIAEALRQLNPNIESLYLFGSRNFNTSSERSDVDILVKHNNYIQPGKFRTFVNEHCEALDLFLIEKNRAVSVINESFIEHDSFEQLITTLNATLFWTKEEGVIDDADIPWKFFIRGDINFTMSILPNIIIDENTSLLPMDVFRSRGYIEKVAYQINISFENALFDCCLVMCRRLIETLIIEVYISKNREDEIKDSDNNFFMFSGLIQKIEEESSFNLSRNVNRGLNNIKRFGDLSAHNRRFNARSSDIEEIRTDLRLISTELLLVSGLMN